MVFFRIHRFFTWIMCNLKSEQPKHSRSASSHDPVVKRTTTNRAELPAGGGSAGGVVKKIQHVEEPPPFAGGEIKKAQRVEEPRPFAGGEIKKAQRVEEPRPLAVGEIKMTQCVEEPRPLAEGLVKKGEDLQERASSERDRVPQRSSKHLQQILGQGGLTAAQKAIEESQEQDGMGAEISSNDRDTLLYALRKVKIFLGLSQRQQETCISTMECIDVESGTVIAAKGELSDYVWVIQEGEVVTEGSGDGEPVVYGPVEAFGEKPLLYNSMQPCTFKTRKPSKIWRLERMCYRRISARNHGSHSRFAEEWYKQVSTWDDLEMKFRQISSRKHKKSKTTIDIKELRHFLAGMFESGDDSEDMSRMDMKSASKERSQGIILDLLMDALDIDKSGDVDIDELRESYHTWFGAALKPVRALIIIDVQNDFIDGTLSLKHCPAGQDGARVVPVINQMRKDVNFDCVAVSLDWHPHRHCSFQESCAEGDFLAPLHPSQSEEEARNAALFDSVVFVAPDGKTEMKQTLWPRHCVQNTWGAECHKDLIKLDDDIIVHKGTNSRIDSYSCVYDNGKYQQTTMLEELRSRGVTHVYLCGLALDVCVTFSALHLAEEGFVTTVVLDACAGVSDEGIAEKLALMAKCGVQLVHSKELPAIVMRPTVVEAVNGALNTSIAKELVHEVENETGHGGKKKQ